MSRNVHRYHRRGNAVVVVAISLPLVLGFAALSVDVGMLYSTKAELQRTADAAAMAAALQLGDNHDSNALARAKQSVSDMGARNTVLTQALKLDLNTDLVVGQGYVDPTTQKYMFNPTNVLPNAARVIARRTAGSPSGPVPLFFANVFGKSTADVSASATAVLTPRDIAFVLDLSGSHNDNSSLQSCKKLQIGNRGVWANLWDTSLAPQPVLNGLPMGPSLGNMSNWGDLATGPNGINTADPGLIYLPRNQNWNLTSTFVSQTLAKQGYANYTAAELAVINSSANDSSYSAYKRRVQVALGLLRWQSSGSKDTTIDSTEVSQVLVPYPSDSSNPATKCRQIGGSWSEYIDYVTEVNGTSNMCNYDPNNYMWGDPNCQYRYGLKTLVDFAQDQYPNHADSPGLEGNQEQPMGAVADGVTSCINIIQGLQSNDQVGMASFATYGYGPDNEPNSMSWLTTDFNSVLTKAATLQASMWSGVNTPAGLDQGTTNTAQGIDAGVNVLFNSPTSRRYAAKVMILLTDGRPNQTRANPTRYYQDKRGVTNTQPYLDATAAAQAAAKKGVLIYTIGVGIVATEPALQSWLADLASIGHGSSFTASGDIATYTQQLQNILKDLGGRRPIVLMQ